MATFPAFLVFPGSHDIDCSGVESEQQKDVRAMIEILRYLTDRRDGKAFVAENPATSQKSDALQQDSRLQAAIQELVRPRVLTPQIEKPEKPN